MKLQIQNSAKKYSLQFDLSKKSATYKMFLASCCTVSMKSFFNLSKIQEVPFLGVILILWFSSNLGLDLKLDCNVFAALRESIYGIVRGIVRINNPFLICFLLIKEYQWAYLKNSWHCYYEKKLLDMGEIFVILLWHSSRLSRNS